MYDVKDFCNTDYIAIVAVAIFIVSCLLYTAKKAAKQ